MKTIIVYYSLGGFTKSLAEKLAAKTGADLLALHPVKPYPDKGAKRFMIGGQAALAGATPKLQPYTFNAKKYDQIVLCTPVWASSPTPPLHSFVAAHGEALADKKLAALFTQLGNGADKAEKKLLKWLGKERFDATTVIFEPNKKDAHKENAAKLGEFVRILKAND